MTESTDSMTQAAQSRVFVDGNNVMGSRPDGWWRDRAEAARRLVAEIIPVALDHGGAWTIVFDGKEPPAMPLPPECLTVIYTGHSRRNGADDRIVELVDALPNSVTSVVYTSDAKLRTRVEALGTHAVGSGTLLRQTAAARGTMDPFDTGHTPNPADDAHVTDGPVRTSPESVTTGLALVLSDDFDPRDSDAARAALCEHLEVRQPTFYGRFAADPNLVSIIRLIGDALAWLPLSAAATVYLSTLAKHAGDATWSKIESLRRNKEVKPLTDIATTLATTASKADGRVQIAVGLNVPDDFWGTCITIRGQDPEEITRKMAAFLVHVEELSRVMKAEMEAGRTPLGPAFVEIQEDGSLRVKWRTAKDFKEHERVIP